jgi:uncharacterized protein YqhQ
VKKKPDVGGMAVIEGVFMKSPQKAAVAIRKEDKTIDVKILYSRVPKGILAKPFLRGVFALYYTMVEGIKILNHSAVMSSESDPITKKDLVISLLVAVLFAAGLFFILPLFLAYLIEPIRGNDFAFAMVEGLIRIAIFIIYLLAIKMFKDVRRVFQYHGAEHKTINTYESGDELTPENAKKHSRIHPRCGTSFLVFVIILSVFVFSVFAPFFQGFWMRVLSRIVLIPVIASLAYEILKLSASHPKNIIFKMIAFPGLATQYITTSEPDLEMLEVGIAALKASLEGTPWEIKETEKEVDEETNADV